MNCRRYFLSKIRQLFPELLQLAFIVAHSITGPRWTCRACWARVHVPLLVPDVSLVWWERLIVLECSDTRQGGVVGVGAVCGWTHVLQWDSRHSPQECSRDRGARSYQPALHCMPRELCQRGREEKTHSSDTQWVRACTLLSYLQYVCLHTVACEQWRKQHWDL